MLQFIYGTAGTGKTTEMFKEIGKVIKVKQKVILIVPEQYSFASERRLHQEFGAKSSLYAQVLGFTRVCNSIFREYGGLAGAPITDTARYLLMSIAVEQLKDQLQVYRKSSRDTSFLNTMIATCSEFKTAGVSSLELESFTASLEQDKLGKKMSDISLIYSAYQALMEKGYSDPEDDLIKACEILENNAFFKDTYVFVDGFTTFMAGEFELLEHAVVQSKKTTFALTTNSLVDHQQGTGVFSVVQAAALRLTKHAQDYGVEILPDIKLETPYRFDCEPIAYLSKEYMQPSAKAFTGDASCVEVYGAKTAYDEILHAACQIAALIREENYRYNEIAVVARNAEDFLSTIQLVFDRYNIPYFTDQPIDIESTPLVFGILSAIDAIESGYQWEKVLLFAKSPILGLDIEKVAQLENYVYSWQIKGAAWRSDFVNNPRGMVEDFAPNDIETLKEINSTRSAIIEPLVELSRQIEKGSGKSFAYGIYEFLQGVSVSKNLTDFAQGMGEEDEESFLTLNAQLWDIVIDVIDVFGQVLADYHFDKARMIELFRLAVSSAEIGQIPQTLDQVLVGSADRIRPENVKAVFIIGANEGIFPAAVQNVGVFSNLEREKLSKSGLDISPGGIYQALLEQFFSYFALTIPSQRLYVSYSLSDLTGGEKIPSEIIEQISDILPNHGKSQLDDSQLIVNRLSALSLLAQQYHEDTPLRASLYEYFDKDSKEVLSKINNAAWKKPYSIEDINISRNLFGDFMRLSPSKIERYYRCPFAYFAQDGLRIKRRRKIEFSPLESGSVMHYVLQVMMEKYGGKGLSQLSEKEMQAELSEIIKDYLDERIEDTDELSSRFTYLFQRLCTTLSKLLFHLGKEFSQSQYEPVAFELSISRDGQVEPVKLTTPNGVPVTVEGIVDRVDIMETDGEKYIRVVDYKSGSKDFRLHHVLQGLNLQMLIYLFTLKETGKGDFENAKPAGVLYMPVRESYMSLERNIHPEQAQNELEKQWTMSGLLLDDEKSLTGMEENLNGLFIPVSTRKDGKLTASSSVASAEHMGKLANDVKEQITEMAHNLSQGEIPAYPVNSNEFPTCSYCDYRDVCGYEEGDPVREILPMSKNEIIDYLEKEGENE